MMKTAAFTSVVAVALLLTLSSGVATITVRAQQMPARAYQIWTHYQASDGRAADEFFARGSDGVSLYRSNGVSELNLPSRGMRIRFSDRNSNITTFGLGKPLVAFEHKPDCQGAGVGPVVPGETRIVLGFNTVHAAATDDLGNGQQLHTTAWLAPDLNCHVLLEEIAHYDNGKVTLTETKTATKALLGDPPVGLLSIPQGIEVPPSKFWSDLGQERKPATAARLDQKYFNEKAVRDHR